MKGYLTENQINYVLFHLGMNIDLHDEIRNSFSFQKNTHEKRAHPSIIFKLDKVALHLDQMFYYEGIPVLFSDDSSKNIFEIVDKDVVFHHDLLKSIFYLLSGFQEINADYHDGMGRYPYELSIQSKLGIAEKPIVNYYFKFISEGIRTFCSINNLPFRNKENYKNFAFSLTHDIDEVDTYSLYNTGYKIKQAFGLAPTSFPRKLEFKIATKYVINSLRIKKRNPAWTFPMLIEAAERHNLKPTYFFLPKGKMHHDAYYSFGEERIKNLFNLLDEKGFEIGLHGTVKSSEEKDGMSASFRNLAAYSPQQIYGIRQHRLLYNISKTPFLQEEQGLEYDASLGFAEHEGFRNSYCLPFRLFDHKNDRMMNLWELPLAAMDVTLFHYRQLRYQEVNSSLLSLAGEVKKFNGVFTLLWHNNFFNEDYYPGINKFFVSLLERISEFKPEGLTGHETIHRISSPV